MAIATTMNDFVYFFFFNYILDLQTNLSKSVFSHKDEIIVISTWYLKFQITFVYYQLQ
jgi:hypothetical protein